MCTQLEHICVHMSERKTVECDKCGKHFRDACVLRKHKQRKTPCAPILDEEDLSDEVKEKPHKCRFCGRQFTTSANLARHLKKSCKIVPKNGDTTGMDKLYEHVLRKQEMKHKKELEGLEVRMRAEMDQLKTTISQGGPHRGAEHKEVKVANVNAHKAITDQSTGKTVNKTTININIFGAENTSHITQRDVLGLFRSLGPTAQVQDLAKLSDRLILSMAMMIYSDVKYPENITCYLPSKKGKEALVHAAGGWEVMPVSLTLSPMASRSVDELFKKQPWAGLDGIAADENLDEPSRILSYIAKNEGDLVGGAAAPGSDLRAIPIRNKEILEKVLAKLPRMGDT